MIDYRLVEIVRGIQESDFDGNVADGKAFEQSELEGIPQAGGILLGGENHLLAGGNLMEGMDQLLYFLSGEVVMVGELEQRDLVVLLKVFLEWLRMDDAREQKDVAGILGERTAPFEGNGKTIVETGEEDFLMGEGVESVPYLVLLLVGEIVRTFGYDDKVGPTALPTAFPEVSERQNLVVVEGTFVFGEEDVDRGLYITMLINIVEHDNLGLLLQLHEIPNAFHSFLADRRDDVGEFGCYHRGLVAQQLGRRERGWLRG